MLRESAAIFLRGIIELGRRVVPKEKKGKKTLIHTNGDTTLEDTDGMLVSPPVHSFCQLFVSSENL